MRRQPTSFTFAVVTFCLPCSAKPGGISSLLLLALLAFPTLAQTNTQAVASDPQAVALATKAFAALTGGAQIQDVSLSGSANRVAGADEETGTVILKALGATYSELNLNLSGGVRSEVRTAPGGVPQGSWTAPNGSVNPFAQHNCLTDAAWFFPALSALSQLSNPNLIAKYIGQETRGQEAVQHLQLFLTLPVTTSDPSGLYSTLTTEDLYLDASSFLPVALKFSAHPDNNALANIPVEVDFSNYQSVSGIQVPFRIQKLLNGSLFLDITVQSAVLNSGLTDADFAAN